MPLVCWNRSGRVASRVAEHRLRARRTPAPGRAGAARAGGERLVEVLAALGQVGAVDREAGEQLGDRVRDDAGSGAVRRRSPRARATIRRTSELQDAVGDRALGVVDHRGASRPGRRAAGPRARRAAPGPAGSVSTRSTMRERVVPGGAGGRPGRRQRLAGLEDLLDQHVGAAGQRGQVVEVAARVAQAVGVVDPQPVDEALVEPAPDLDVGVGEAPRGSSTRTAARVLTAKKRR